MSKIVLCQPYSLYEDSLPSAKFYHYTLHSHHITCCLIHINHYISHILYHTQHFSVPTFVQVIFLLFLLLLLMSLVLLSLNCGSERRPRTYMTPLNKVKQQQQQQQQDSEVALDRTWAQDDGRLIHVIQESFLHRPPPLGPLRLTQVKREFSVN